jgi:hypothetical protein
MGINKMKILVTNILLLSQMGSGLKVAKHIRDYFGIDNSILTNVTYPRNRKKSETCQKSVVSIKTQNSRDIREMCYGHNSENKI